MNAAELEPVFGADSHAKAVRALAEQHELFRFRAQTLLDSAEWVRTADPETLAWARKWAALAPLDSPLGTGDPA